MSPDRLAEIQERAEKATPGPWDTGDNWHWASTHPPVAPERDTCAFCHLGPPDIVKKLGGKKRREEHGHYQPADAALDQDAQHRVETATGGTIAGNYDYEEGGIIDPSDAAFIAHAREDVPWLVGEIQRLRTALEGLRVERHEECEDGWYSCPKVSDYYGPLEDSTNAIVDAALAGSVLHSPKPPEG